MLGDLLDFWCTWNSSSSYLLEPFERSSSSFFCGLVMCGDFNEIAKAHEKFGGYIRPHQQIHIFREAIDQCGFVDLGYVGWKFTWYKNYPCNVTIWECLDRASGTNVCVLFPGLKGDGSQMLVIQSQTHCNLPLRDSREKVQTSLVGGWELSWLNKIGLEDKQQWFTYGSSQREDYILSKTIFYNITKTLIDKKKLLQKFEEAALGGDSFE